MTQTRFDMDKRFTQALQSWPSYLPELRNCIGELRQKTVNRSLDQYMKDRIASSENPAKEVLRSTRFLIAQLYSIELQRFQDTNPSSEQLRFCLSRDFMRHHLELLERTVLNSPTEQHKKKTFDDAASERGLSRTLQGMEIGQRKISGPLDMEKVKAGRIGKDGRGRREIPKKREMERRDACSLGEKNKAGEGTAGA